jgi:hypothetical protein
MAVPSDDFSGSDGEYSDGGQKIRVDQIDYTYETEEQGRTGQAWELAHTMYDMWMDMIPDVTINKLLEDGHWAIMGKIGEEFIVQPTPSFVTWLIDKVHLDSLIRDIHALFARVKPTMGAAEVIPIGYASWEGGELAQPGTSIVHGPKKDVRFEAIVTRPYDYTFTRFNAAWQIIYAYAAQQMAEAVGDSVYTEVPNKYKRAAYHAFAAMDLGLQAGWAEKAEKGVENMEGSGLLEKVKPYLLHPFSRGYPTCSPSTVFADERIFKRWLLFNILRALIPMRVGGLTAEIRYENKSKLYWHQVKAIAPTLFNPPFNMGGADDVYMPTPWDPNLKPLIDPIPFPLLKSKECEYDRRVTKDLNVDSLDMRYGEYQIQGIDENPDTIKRYHIKVVREGRIAEKEAHWSDFVIAHFPIVPRDISWKEFSISAYLSDYSDKPGGVCPIVPSLVATKPMIPHDMDDEEDLNMPAVANRDLKRYKSAYPILV